VIAFSGGVRTKRELSCRHSSAAIGYYIKRSKLPVAGELEALNDKQLSEGVSLLFYFIQSIYPGSLKFCVSWGGITLLSANDY
jgi:hypothetical protein